LWSLYFGRWRRRSYFVFVFLSQCQSFRVSVLCGFIQATTNRKFFQHNFSLVQRHLAILCFASCFSLFKNFWKFLHFLSLCCFAITCSIWLRCFRILNIPKNLEFLNETSVTNDFSSFITIFSSSPFEVCSWVFGKQVHEVLYARTII